MENQNLAFFATIRFLALPVVIFTTGFILFILASIGLLPENIAFGLFAILIVTEVIVWLVLFAKESYKLHQNGETAKRNANIIIVVLTFLIPFTLYNYAFGDQYMYSEKSPCGNYEVDIYTEPHIFAMPGGGGLFSRTSKVILKNKWGWTIGASNSESAVFYGDIDIEWDYENNCVWFAKARSIDLDNGKCEYK